MPDTNASAPSPVTQRDLWDAIERLRTETREARHNQSNNLARALSELRLDMDTRLRTLENVMASSNPVSLGPRLNDLERWQSRMDGDDVGGAPHRLGLLEDRESQRDGVVKAIGIIATIAGLVSAVVGLIVIVGPRL